MDIGERVASIEKDVEIIHTEIKDIKSQNEAIYKIATSVEVIAHDLKSMQKKVDSISDGQQELGAKLDNEIDRVRDEQETFRQRLEAVDGKGAKLALKFLGGMGEKAAWLIVGAILAFLMYSAFPFLK